MVRMIINICGHYVVRFQAQLLCTNFKPENRIRIAILVNASNAARNSAVLAASRSFLDKNIQISIAATSLRLAERLTSFRDLSSAATLQIRHSPSWLASSLIM